MSKRRANGEGNIRRRKDGRWEGRYTAGRDPVTGKQIFKNVLGLKWTDIDWENGIIKVRRQVARVDGQIVEAPLKTKNSYRAVTISQQAIEVLKQQKEKTSDEYVFPVAVPGRCGVRQSGLASRRPLPLAQVASSATGGAPIAPPPPTAVQSRRTV